MDRPWSWKARVVAIVVATGLALPLLGLIPAAVVDVGPSGKVRVSLFPAAIVFLDPFLWVCARNSVIVAAIVTALSLVLGVGIARTVGPWRFWGRGPLAMIAWMPLAVAPAFAAVGLARLIPAAELGRWLAAATGRALLFGVGWDAWIGWGLLGWVGVATATPVIALAVKSALGRIDPGWIEMGRGLGASRRRAWRDLAWPIVRPEVARTLAAVFATALLEPGAPLVLGLRRTLAYQVVEAVDRGEASTHVASIALIGLALALAGRVLIRWWGGARGTNDPSTREDRPGRPRPLSALLGAVGLLAWVVFATMPVAGLVGIVSGAFEAGDRGWVVAVASAIYAMIDPDNVPLWINAFWLGAASTALAASVVSLGSTRGVRPIPAVLVLERTPPLVIGVAAAILPSLLLAASIRLGTPLLGRASRGLDPAGWSGLLLIAATAATRLPTLARATDRATLASRASLSDVARSLGASRRHAARLAGGRGPGLGPLALTFTLAATSVVPALVLTPTIATRTVGPGIVLLADDPPRAAGLALGAVALNLVGLTCARRGRSGPAGDWFRG